MACSKNLRSSQAKTNNQSPHEDKDNTQFNYSQGECHNNPERHQALSGRAGLEQDRFWEVQKTRASRRCQYKGRDLDRTRAGQNIELKINEERTTFPKVLSETYTMNQLTGSNPTVAA